MTALSPTSRRTKKFEWSTTDESTRSIFLTSSPSAKSRPVGKEESSVRERELTEPDYSRRALVGWL